MPLCLMGGKRVVFCLWRVHQILVLGVDACGGAHAHTRQVHSHYDLGKATESSSQVSLFVAHAARMHHFSETCLPGFAQCFDCAFTMLCLSTICACSRMAEAPL